MNTTEHKLRERIKELTCMYEVTSIIVNCNYEQLELPLEAIAICLKKAVQYESDCYVKIETSEATVDAGKKSNRMHEITADINVFNRLDGAIGICYPASKYTNKDFLAEEKKLLENIALEIGNLLERKQIRESEAQIKKQMERADRLNILGEITAGIAHELNTPLTNILGFSELLESQLKKNSLKDDLDKIRDNALYCREIVKKLMFFACEVPQQMEEIPLKPVIENVLNLLGPTFKNKNVAHQLEFDQSEIYLKADEIQLTQVLFNLIMNALYYSPEESTIAITVAQTKKTVTIGIADQGRGILKELENKIFEPFFTTKPVGEGSGLGLSVVHGIMNSHKGTITHKANQDKGTIFELSFPK